MLPICSPRSPIRTAAFLDYTYNSGGQRIQMADQTGFTVNYQYNALGQLTELTDGNGNLIVSYSYDAVGAALAASNSATAPPPTTPTTPTAMC